MKKRLIKLYEEFTTLKKSAGNPPPPIDFFDKNGDDDDDDDKGDYFRSPVRYYIDLIVAFEDEEYGMFLHEVWNDEIHLKKLQSKKDSDFYQLCQNLYNKYRLNHKFFQKEINEILESEIIKYNKWAEEFRNTQRREKEVNDIMNTKQEKIEDISFTYKLEDPELALIKRFMYKENESEADAKKPLLYILDSKIDGYPEPDEYSDEWTKWVKDIYNPRFEKLIMPWAKENGYRLWSY